MNLPRFSLHLRRLFICVISSPGSEGIRAKLAGFGPYFHRFSTLIAAILVLGFAFYLYRHLRGAWKERKGDSPSF
jgi:hypothetical protein